MVIIDPPKFHTGKGTYSHMAAGSIQELKSFAKKVGLGDHWFQNKKRKYQPHYDVPFDFYQRCLDAGAKEIDSRGLFSFLFAIYNPAQTKMKI